MRKLALLIFIIMSGVAVPGKILAATPNFPALTGRVVDDANILPAQAQQQLSDLLAEHEKQTTDQFVVVTVPSLQGLEIEDYGYQLGRHWGIGQKGKNNGVLLIVAPKERRVRIEVGYGLEGTLTDALSSKIINSIILPRFHDGDMPQGIIDGSIAIVSILEGKPVSLGPAGAYQQADDFPPYVIIIFIILFFVLPVTLRYFLGIPLGGGSWRGGGGFGGGGGGFSGGGGSFGGGGSSGRW